MKVSGEGRLEGLEELAEAGQHVEGGTAITALLLGLLVTFIGELLTLCMVRDAWPGVSLEE